MFFIRPFYVHRIRVVYIYIYKFSKNISTRTFRALLSFRVCSVIYRYTGKILIIVYDFARVSAVKRNTQNSTKVFVRAPCDAERPNGKQFNNKISAMFCFRRLLFMYTRVPPPHMAVSFRPIPVYDIELLYTTLFML